MEDQSDFDNLKEKYQPVLDLMVEHGIHVTRLDLQDHKLLVEGEAQSEYIQQELSERISELYTGLVCDLRVNTSTLQTEQETGLAANDDMQSFVVTDPSGTELKADFNER